MARSQSSETVEERRKREIVPGIRGDITARLFGTTQRIIILILSKKGSSRIKRKEKTKRGKKKNSRVEQAQARLILHAWESRRSTRYKVQSTPETTIQQSVVHNILHALLPSSSASFPSASNCYNPRTEASQHKQSASPRASPMPNPSLDTSCPEDPPAKPAPSPHSHSRRPKDPIIGQRYGPCMPGHLNKADEILDLSIP